MIGFRIVFSTPKTAAAQMSVHADPSFVTPLSSQVVIARTTAFNTQDTTIRRITNRTLTRAPDATNVHRVRTARLFACARYAVDVIPWIVFAVVVVPLVVIGFVVTRRKTVAFEHPANEDAEARARTEQEFADAEAYEAKWREEDKARYHQERLP